MPQRPDTRAQLFLLPPSLDELVAQGHPVRYVAAFVDALTVDDWAELGIASDPTALGAPRYAPALLLRVWLSGFVLGIRSARGLERGCRERFDLYWAAGGQHPDHNTLWRFYQTHRTQLRPLLHRTITTAVAIGLVDLAVQAVDGTKLVASANPDLILDADQLAHLAHQIDAAIAELESSQHGDEPPPPQLPTPLHDAQVLRERIVAARAEPTDPEHRPPPINRTDPQARMMKTRGGSRLAYNAQLVVTPTDAGVGNGPGRLILAAQVTTQANDVGLLAPMALVAQVANQPTPITLADAGYSSQASLRAAQSAGVRVVAPLQRQRQQDARYAKEQFVYDAVTDTYTCPEGQVLSPKSRTRSHGQPAVRYGAEPGVCISCPAFGSCTTSRRTGRLLKIPASEEWVRQHAVWMATDEAKQLSAMRQGLIEPVFGIIKEVMGGRRTLLRGRVKVEAEWVLTAIAFNLKTLARALAPPPVT